VADKLIDIYDSIVSELQADIFRRLDKELASSRDYPENIEKLNHFFSKEIAAIKAQILDLEIRATSEICNSPRPIVAPMASGVGSCSPGVVFGAGDVIASDSPLFTFGMHPVELSGGRFFRWAGLMRLFGIVAPIQRAAAMQAKAIFNNVIAPEVAVSDVQIDGMSVPFEFHSEALVVTFLIPERKVDHTLMQPTALAIETSTVVRPSDLDQNSSDNRYLSFAFDRIELSAQFIQKNN
jgi:hypothetical protein